MEKYCLNVQELTRFLDIHLQNGQLYDDEMYLDSLFDQWRNWEVSITCMTLLLSQVLETKQKQKIDCEDLLIRLVSIEEEFGYSIDFATVDAKFIDYMFSVQRSGELSIEEDLIDLHNRYGRYEF